MEPRYKKWYFKVDMVASMMLMGTTGLAIGFHLGGVFWPIAAAALGMILGGYIATLQARLFFISVMVGTVLGGLLALWLGGSYALVIGAGSGGAIGGFIGVNIELFMRES